MQSKNAIEYVYLNERRFKLYAIGKGIDPVLVDDFISNTICTIAIKKRSFKHETALKMYVNSSIRRQYALYVVEQKYPKLCNEELLIEFDKIRKLSTLFRNKQFIDYTKECGQLPTYKGDVEYINSYGENGKPIHYEIKH